MGVQASSDSLVCGRPGPVDAAIMNMDITGRSGQPFVAEQLLDGFQVYTSGIQRGGAVVAQPVRRESSCPGRKPPFDGLRQAGAQRVVADPGAAAGQPVVTFAGQQRRVRVGRMSPW